MTSLPKRVLDRLERLSDRTGETPAAIIEDGIKLYEKQLKSKRTRPVASGSVLEALVPSAEKREIFKEVSKLLSHYALSKMTAEMKAERASLGGKARHAKLTAARRKEISEKATAASKAARKKRREEADL